MPIHELVSLQANDSENDHQEAPQGSQLVANQCKWHAYVVGGRCSKKKHTIGVLVNEGNARAVSIDRSVLETLPSDDVSYVARVDWTSTLWSGQINPFAKTVDLKSLYSCHFVGCDFHHDKKFRLICFPREELLRAAGRAFMLGNFDCARGLHDSRPRCTEPFSENKIWEEYASIDPGLRKVRVMCDVAVTGGHKKPCPVYLAKCMTLGDILLRLGGNVQVAFCKYLMVWAELHGNHLRPIPRDWVVNACLRSEFQIMICCGAKSNYAHYPTRKEGNPERVPEEYR